MTKEQIKESYSMKDILARYGLQANRSGFIPCPFHKEDTASMKIYGKDYHCFGCGENGDIFSFVQRMEELSFMDAFRVLGGTCENESRTVRRMRLAAAKRKKDQMAEEESRFLSWRKGRLNEVCRLLQLLDAVIPDYVPFSDEWATAIAMHEKNNYKYMILTSGTRAEQEEMRALDE